MPNEVAFLLCAVVTLTGAVAAMMLRNLVHCALCAAGAFAGLAALYLQLDAQFAGFAQLLVYVGAVAILIVFTVLLTQGAEIKPGASSASPAPWMGLLTGALVVACLIGTIVASPSLFCLPSQTADAPVKEIGNQLMSQYVMPLETIGLLLTAALLGAVVIALREPPKSEPPAR
jgi:NADH-quinone oxidoreductase subunit J